jgi:hypothetical protein
MQTTEEHKLYFWLAINGASCASSAIPMPITVKVSPTPERLIGYTTREKQLKAQKFFLEAPIKDIAKYMRKTFPKEVSDGMVMSIIPKAPEPPTKGQTFWGYGKGE